MELPQCSDQAAMLKALRENLAAGVEEVDALLDKLAISTDEPELEEQMDDDEAVGDDSDDDGEDDHATGIDPVLEELFGGDYIQEKCPFADDPNYNPYEGELVQEKDPWHDDPNFNPYEGEVVQEKDPWDDTCPYDDARGGQNSSTFDRACVIYPLDNALPQSTPTKPIRSNFSERPTRKAGTLNKETVVRIECILAEGNGDRIPLKMLEMFRDNHFSGDNETLAKIDALIEQAKRRTMEIEAAKIAENAHTNESSRSGRFPRSGIKRHF